VRRAWAPPVAIVAASVAWALAVGIDHRFISFSDGAYTYLASVVATQGGHDLYRSVVFSQPPATLLGASLVWRASPHIETIRVLLAGLAGVRSLLTYAVARTLGLNRVAATTAALITLTAPVRGQFSGLDGEALLAPLALALAWSALRRRVVISGALAGMGLLVKLTWAPALLVLAFTLARRDRRALLRASLAAAITFAGLAATLFAVFGWKLNDVLAQVVLAQLHSGMQPVVTLGIVIVLVGLWWPLLAFVPAGLRTMRGVAPVLAAVTIFMVLATLKKGTFFNVFDPLEPFLAIAAAAGALEAWSRRTALTRALIILCSVGLAAHVASISDSRIADAIPFPLGATFVHTDNEARVDAIARAIDTHSQPGDAVLVNPFFALVAHRREVSGQADWFILHALQDYCGPKRRPASYCGLWAQMTSAARKGRVPVLTVDSNVLSFDKTFRTETGVAKMRPLLTTNRLPIKNTLYVSAGPAHS
jgi:hypothetical protein